MFPPFPQDQAFEHCIETVQQIQNGEYKVVRITEESQDRIQNGFMIGCMVCIDDHDKTIILKTISGIANKLEKSSLVRESDNSIFVAPIVSNKEIHKAYEANDIEIHSLTDRIEKLQESFDESDKDEIKRLKKRRIALCTDSLKAIHKLYHFHCADKSIKTIHQICEERNRKALTQTGTGECCAPKLINYAFSHNMRPVSLAEVYYNLQTNSCDFQLYEPCNERCGVLLPSMLGIEILYRDDDICVVNKQSGILSVPGRLPENKDSITTRFRTLFPHVIEQCAAHRLDQETSGLMVLVFNKNALRSMTKQFEEKTIQKEYTALIDGVLPKLGVPNEGQNELYFRVDIDNRPHQIWDPVYGKKAVTQWRIIRVERYTAPDGSTRNVTRVLFTPHTGRTHQLRLCASDRHGFGTPIIGDSLYGNRMEGERLMLHARYIKFEHPVTGDIMEFTSECPF